MEQLKRTFFVDTVTYQREKFLHLPRYGKLFVEVLTSYRDQGKYELHELVLMPDHFHLILTPAPTCSLEKVMQFIKGGYSYRVRKELRSGFEIWQRSFTVHRVENLDDYQRHRTYIHLNPVRAKLVAKPEDWELGSACDLVRLDPPPEHLRG